MSLIAETPTSAAIRADGEVKRLFIPAARVRIARQSRNQRENRQDARDAKEDSFPSLGALGDLAAKSSRGARLFGISRSVIDEHPVVGRKVLWRLAETLSRRLVATDQQYARALRRVYRRSAIRHLFALFKLNTRIMLSLVWIWFRRKIRLPMAPAKLSRVHRRNARAFKETASRLKGANVKVGQLASLQAHLLPPEYVEELRDLRDNVAPTEYPLVAGVFQHEFGLGPLDIFAEFDKVPIAAASMGQVHGARLPTGEKVAVKLLHPGLERSVAIDLWLMRRILSVLSWFVHRVDLMQIFREAEEPLRNELDLIRTHVHSRARDRHRRV